MYKKIIFRFVFLCLLFLMTSNAHALVIGTDLFGIDFRYNNPGARANGMGGAFIGLADDATAAFTNPSGLTILTQPEISVEYKWAEYTTTVFDSIGKTEYDDSVDSVSFLSYAYPKDKATVTVFRHQLVNIESNYSWHESHWDDGLGKEVEQSSQIHLELDAYTLGAGLGLKLSDSLSLGLTVGFSELDYKLSYDELTQADYKESVNDHDTATHYSFAMLWNPFEGFNMGVVYRQGPEFDTRKTRYEYETISDAYLQEFDLENTLKVPDVYGLGFSYRFFAGLTAVLDINYVEYSDLNDDLITNEDSNDDDDGGAPKPHELETDDATEFHIGFEYIFDVKNTPLAARCGYYYRPDHRMEYSGDSEFLNNILQKVDGENIFSLGFGTVFSENTQIDMAVSIGDLSKECTFSIVYRYD